MAYRFKVIGDNLVECTDTENGDKVILSEEEAVLVGFRRFTYKGEPISVYEFAKMIGKTPGTVECAVRRNQYTTGEQVIKHYSNSRNYFNYGNFDIKKLEKVLNRKAENIMYVIRKYQFKTEQELVEFYRKIDENPIKNITYKGGIVSLREIAAMVDRGTCQVANLIKKYGYTTGEQVIAHYSKCNKQRDYSNIDVAKLAKGLNKKESSIRASIRRNNLNSEQEVVDHYSSIGREFTYKGCSITLVEFARIIGKQASSVGRIVRVYNYSTGEQVIAHYNNSVGRRKRRDIRYNGEWMSLEAFAQLIGKSSRQISTLKYKRRFTTGEEVIEYYRKLGKL